MALFNFGNTRILANGLPRLIQNATEHGSERKVYLRADARANYGDVKAVLDLIRESGIQDVTLIVEEARRPDR